MDISSYKSEYCEWDAEAASPRKCVCAIKTIMPTDRASYYAI